MISIFDIFKIENLDVILDRLALLRITDTAVDEGELAPLEVAQHTTESDAQPERLELQLQ